MSAPWSEVEGEWVVEASELGWRVALLQGAGWTDPVVLPCNRRLVIFND